MNIVVLERNSVGTDIPVDYSDLGEVTYYENTVTAEEVAERVKDADIIVTNKAPINEVSLKDAPNVKLVCVFATGYDTIDIAYCKSRGIPVCNVVDYSTCACFIRFSTVCASSVPLPTKRFLSSLALGGVIKINKASLY